MADSTPVGYAERWRQRILTRSRRASQHLAFAPRRATSGFRPLPDFVIIGAGKSGTTSLFEYVMEHPLVRRPATKEVRYFSNRHDRGLGWYRAHFPTRSERSPIDGLRPLTGEASPAYLSHPAVPERVARVLPDVRLVAVLRNPVDRAISAYHDHCKYGGESRPVEQAISECLERTRVEDPISAWDDFRGFRRLADYVGRGEYEPALRRWHEQFGPEQLLVLESDDLSRGGDGFARVLDHLGLPAWRPEEFTEHNAGSYEPAPPAVREMLSEHYRPFNAALWELVGEDWGWDEPAEVTG